MTAPHAVAEEERPQVEAPETGAHLGAPAEVPEQVGTRRGTRLRRLSLGGATLALLFAGMSVTPSLVPRWWLWEGLLSGLCLITGYALGAFLGWAYRALELPVLAPSARAVAWRVLAVAATAGLLVAGWLGRWWQAGQRDLLGMDQFVSWLWVPSPLLGFLLAVLLLALGRGVLWVGRRLFGLLGRVLPSRVSGLIAIAITVGVTYTLFSGVLLGSAISLADDIFEGNNHDDKPGVVNPQSPYRSGGPRSGVSWDSIGREGRSFIWQGPTAKHITGVVGDPAAQEPVRAYVGLAAAATPTERATLAVEELRRLGGFHRKAIAVAAGTGSGWIDPKVAASLEYAVHGNLATVSMQYSYLPSWLSFLVDQQRAQSNAEELITAIRVELNAMPADQRPQLYVYGESLGAFSTDSAFTSVEDMSTTTDGALLIGPPSFDLTWQKLVDGRDPGSPIWKPRYGAGALARVAATDQDLTDPSLTWRTDNRIIYLVHASDPIVAWTADHPAWLDPRGPDVSRWMIAWPLVSVWQASVDQFAANSTPPGHGHVYDQVVVTAWSQILGPPSLPDPQVKAIRQAISVIGQGTSPWRHVPLAGGTSAPR
jgi:uncharacterized membrane protein